MSNWTKEDIELVNKFIEIRGKGLYCDGNQVTEIYNRVLNKNVRPTNCGQCIRQRVNELEASMRRFIEKSNANKEEQTKEETSDGSEQTTSAKKPRGKGNRKEGAK